MISKRKVLKSVEILSELNIINVLWSINIEEDGIVISSTNHRCSYSEGQLEKFKSEVEQFEKYVNLITW